MRQKFSEIIITEQNDDPGKERLSTRNIDSTPSASVRPSGIL